MSRAYYNEIDPYAAQWLRNLIDEGLIAPGDVDERSITDVVPHDLDGYTQCHFFAGIGVWSHALRGAGWPDDREVWTGSCPCQPFSAAGKRKGTADDRHLWPEFFRLIRARRPDVVFGEQVASKDGLAWLDIISADLEGASYSFGAADTCAAGFGAPHIRQRLYFVGHIGSVAGLEGRGGSERGGERADRPTPSLCSSGRERVGYSERTGRQSVEDVVRGGCEGVESSRRESLEPSETGGGARGAERVADSATLGRQREQVQEPTGIQPQVLRAGEQRLESGAHGAVLGRVADDAGLEGRNVGWQGSDEQPLRSRGVGHKGSRPTNGFWRAADWLYCRDGKWRAVEPGTFPLVDGPAARVGRLRAYGNAIVAPQAQGFIEAYLEVCEGSAR